jgi:prevent-host-death family protein
VVKQRVVNVTEFKAKCLALLDGVGERGETIIITRRGRPLASVGPVSQTAWKSPEGAWAGKVTIADDLLELEADTSGLWEAVPEPAGERS